MKIGVVSRRLSIQEPMITPAAMRQPTLNARPHAFAASGFSLTGTLSASVRGGNRPLSGGDGLVDVLVAVRRGDEPCFVL